MVISYLLICAFAVLLSVAIPSPVRPEIGSFNHLESSIGMRGMGKSTFQCYRALVLSRQAGGAYVIGHSLGARLPAQLPKQLGGEKLPIVYHPTIKKLERGLRRDPGKWHILAPPLAEDGDPTDTADELLKYAQRLSLAARKAAWYRVHPFTLFGPYKDMTGVRPVPIIVIVDEGIAVESAGPSRKEANRWFLEFLYSLRHMHVALLWAIQDASARSWRVLEQSTAIHVFAIRHDWALTSVRAAGASEQEIARIERLRPHEHVTLSWENPKEKELRPKKSENIDPKNQSDTDKAQPSGQPDAPIIGEQT